MTQIILEDYDKDLHAERDRKRYRDKGTRSTTIRTVYGDVTYVRHVYQTMDEEGHKLFVYLLDEAVHMDKSGLLFTNLAEKIAPFVTENPYRVTADIISGTSGQTISHGGVWKLVQKLGERVSEEEELQVEQMNADEAEGTREIKVLFEEMDGVWLRLQEKGHCRNGKDPYEPDTVFQLDRFHIRQDIKRKLNRDRETMRAVEELFDAEKMDKMLEYIRMYADSVETDDEKDTRSQKARELYQYLDYNRDGLMPYQKRDIRLPELPEGMRYGNMGGQENRNCTVITIRMKGNRKRWSVKGANNMAKLLYRKENKELVETVNRYADIHMQM